MTLQDIKPGVVPGSDGAGIITSIGSNITAFKVGDRVLTSLCPYVPDDQALLMPDINAGLGHKFDGTLRTHAHFHHTAVVHAPANVSFAGAATLTCSGLTAWNALFGLAGREVKAGDWVLVQGTGGVSIAALQFAVAAGANVVATTSTDAKAARLRELGAMQVLNYRESLDWGVAARNLTPDKRGLDFVVDMGGDATLQQSLAAVRTDGVVVLAGILGTAEPVPMMSALWHSCIVRGLFLGTRQQMRQMVAFIETHDVRPALDEVRFGIQDVKEAYRRLQEQKHFSKVIVELRG